MPDPDEALEVGPTGGLQRAPRPRFARLARALGVTFAIVVLAATVAVAAGSLPSGTSRGALIARGAIALGIGIALTVVVRRMLGALAAPPPPAPMTVDARPADVVYECPVCGTRVRLEVAATAKPPKHCGEEMEAKIG